MRGCLGGVEVYLELGTNLGVREQYLTRAISLLAERVGAVVRCSAIYESEPWGFECNASFLNQIIVVGTDLTARAVLCEIGAIERDLGRIRSVTERYTSRTIDIDILLYGDRVIAEPPDLIVPHPRMAERRFVLVPLVEVASQGVHPVLHKTWVELLAVCPDTGWVRKWEGEG